MCCYQLMFLKNSSTDQQNFTNQIDLIISVSPGLSWDAILKVTEIKSKLISDIGQYYFNEKELRGGISSISKRFSETNNNYMKIYDPTKESKYIIDRDANNLYGWVMVESIWWIEMGKKC